MKLNIRVVLILVLIAVDGGDGERDIRCGASGCVRKSLTSSGVIKYGKMVKLELSKFPNEIAQFTNRTDDLTANALGFFPIYFTCKKY